MNPSLNVVSTRFEALSTESKPICLITAAFNLTLEFRGLCDLPDASARKRGNALNELQHKLLSQVISELRGSDRYPDAILVTILGEVAQAGDVESALIAAFVDALAKVR